VPGAVQHQSLITSWGAVAAAHRATLQQ